MKVVVPATTMSKKTDVEVLATEWMASAVDVASVSVAGMVRVAYTIQETTTVKKTVETTVEWVTNAFEVVLEVTIAVRME